MLMILISTLDVIRHLICGNNQNWLLNLNLIYWGRKWLVDFNPGKTQLISFDRCNNTGANGVNMDESALEEKSYFKILGLTLSSTLDWGSYIISEVCISINLPYVTHGILLSRLGWCSYICYLELLDKLQKRICRNVGPSLATSLEPLARRLSIGITLVNVHLNWLNWLHPLSRGRSRCHLSQMLQGCLCQRFLSSHSFFPLTYDLYGSKSRINRHQLTVSSF